MEHAGHRERLRKRYAENGFAGFAEHEILELLLTFAIPRINTNPQAHRLIERFGSLTGVLEADQKDLNPAQATYALVSLDPDLYRPAADGLRFFWDRLSIGGVILIHDYTSFQYPGIRRAVDEFCDREGLTVIPLPDLHGTAILLKQE